MSDGSYDESYNADMWESTVSNSIEIAATALAAYEFCITFREEVRCVWRRKLSVGSAIFFLNRYALLFYRIGTIMEIFGIWENDSDHPVQQDNVGLYLWFLICTVTDNLTTAFMIIVYTDLAAFSALRLYAIYRKNKTVLVVVLCTGLVYPIMLLRLLVASPQTHVIYHSSNFEGCNSLVSDNRKAKAAYNTLFVSGVVSSIVFETLVVLLTWIKTWGYRRVLRSAEINASLGTLMLRDGTVHFVAILILNVVSLCNRYYQGIFDLLPVAETMTSISLSRFILNLRENYFSGGTRGAQSTPTSIQLSDLHVRVPSRLIGNLGAALDFSSNEDDEEGGVTEHESYDLETSETPLLDGLRVESKRAARHQSR